jgi:hypothetical protein
VLSRKVFAKAKTVERHFGKWLWEPFPESSDLGSRD